jgi:hypothetical protein
VTCVHHRPVWRRREPVLDRETLDGIIRKLMEMDTKLDEILVPLSLIDDEQDDDDA